MKNIIVYIVISIVILEVLREFIFFMKKKRIENAGKGSRGDIARFIDFKKLIIVVLLGVIAYFSFPVIKRQLMESIKAYPWFFNYELLFVFLKAIGFYIAVEIVFLLILMRIFSRLAPVWSRLSRYLTWGIFIYLLIGLWPFCKLAADKIKDSVKKPCMYEDSNYKSEEGINLKGIHNLNDKVNERFEEIE